MDIPQYKLNKNDLTNLKLILYPPGAGGDFLTNLRYVSYINEEIFIDYTNNFFHTHIDFYKNFESTFLYDKIYIPESRRWMSVDSSGWLFGNSADAKNFMLLWENTNLSFEEFLYLLISNKHNKATKKLATWHFNSQHWKEILDYPDKFINSLIDFDEITSYVPWTLRSHPGSLKEIYGNTDYLDPFSNFDVFYIFFYDHSSLHEFLYAYKMFNIQINSKDDIEKYKPIIKNFARHFHLESNIDSENVNEIYDYVKNKWIYTLNHNDNEEMVYDFLNKTKKLLYFQNNKLNFFGDFSQSNTNHYLDMDKLILEEKFDFAMNHNFILKDNKLVKKLIEIFKNDIIRILDYFHLRIDDDFNNYDNLVKHYMIGVRDLIHKNWRA